MTTTESWDVVAVPLPEDDAQEQLVWTLAAYWAECTVEELKAESKAVQAAHFGRALHVVLDGPAHEAVQAAGIPAKPGTEAYFLGNEALPAGAAPSGLLLAAERQATRALLNLQNGDFSNGIAFLESAIDFAKNYQTFLRTTPTQTSPMTTTIPKEFRP